MGGDPGVSRRDAARDEYRCSVGRWARVGECRWVSCRRKGAMFRNWVPPPPVMPKGVVEHSGEDALRHAVGHDPGLMAGGGRSFESCCGLE